ncbi:hypothetical protein KY290_010834 [Solanum tuberosum]|uniref:Integrase core domain containing protein n=1 Tax=Solanum tuberosum TaxID=4113 RepID=A0ABQ7VYW0_SOLTU|nr:hypothetical protein KY290_010834 [Solanum tuberosum]
MSTKTCIRKHERIQVIKLQERRKEENDEGKSVSSPRRGERFFLLIREIQIGDRMVRGVVASQRRVNCHEANLRNASTPRLNDHDLVEPLAEPERFVHYRRRQRRLTYLVPLVASELTTLAARLEREEPALMAKMKVRDVAIPHTTNVTSCIEKPEAGGRFELTQSMVQLLHINGQFTSLSHRASNSPYPEFPRDQ